MSGNRLAISIYSLDQIDPDLLVRVLGSRLDPKRVVEVKQGTQTVRAIPFLPTVPLLAAAIAIDVIQSEMRRVGSAEVQVYHLKSKSWTRIPQSTVLTTLINQRYILNQELFGVDSPDDLVPPERTPNHAVN